MGIHIRNGVEYSGISDISKAQVISALGFTPYDSSNPNQYINSSGSITGSSGSCTGNSATATNASSLGTTVTGTLSAGETSIVLSSSAITTDSLIEVFFEATTATEPICYSTILVEIGSVTLTFESRSDDLKIKIRIS